MIQSESMKNKFVSCLNSYYLLPKFIFTNSTGKMTLSNIIAPFIAHETYSNLKSNFI